MATEDFVEQLSQLFVATPIKWEVCPSFTVNANDKNAPAERHQSLVCRLKICPKRAINEGDSEADLKAELLQYILEYVMHLALQWESMHNPAVGTVADAVSLAIHGMEKGDVYEELVACKAAMRTLTRECQRLQRIRNYVESDAYANRIANDLFLFPKQEPGEVLFLELLGEQGKKLGSWFREALAGRVAMHIREAEAKLTGIASQNDQ